MVDGAKVLTGGQPLKRDGFYFPPTVMSTVPTDASITSEEIFGPVAAPTTFDTEKEAIAAANRTEYGLIAYIYRCDLAYGLRVSERREAERPRARGGHHGILEFRETKYTAVTW